LKDNNLIFDNCRVVVEKPIGSDLESAKDINNSLSAGFKENQIYRIDHYLGKEAVQNLLALRFANTIFEKSWSNSAIDHIQITVAEDLGVEDRGGYYDETGALRDMVQNHLLQILCLIAMEPPVSIQSESVRDEKLKVLKSLAPFTKENIVTNSVRGQYLDGISKGEPACSYLNEEGVDSKNNTETFVALKLEINNWRWSGVPFYLRTGKRMHSKSSEIVVRYKAVPHNIFSKGGFFKSRSVSFKNSSGRRN
jgi:glucose-6-phosphate 1-dehydrogenase